MLPAGLDQVRDLFRVVGTARQAEGDGPPSSPLAETAVSPASRSARPRRGLCLRLPPGRKRYQGHKSPGYAVTAKTPRAIAYATATRVENRPASIAVPHSSEDGLRSRFCVAHAMSAKV